MSDRSDTSVPPHKRKLSLLRTAKAVAWSFVGLRDKAAYEDDIKNLNPVHIIVVGLLGVVVFVGALVALVNWVV